MKNTVILASTSPRRKKLLKKICADIEIVAPTLDKEVLAEHLPLGEALEQLALEKARSVSVNYPQQLVIGADTIVALDNEVLGKPRDKQEAKSMLTRLSGVTHQVLTAVAVVHEAKRIVRTCHVVTDVTFKGLSVEAIEAYIATGEPMDKAGAYGIQGKGGALVASFDGDFDNVVGLPVRMVETLLQECEVIENAREENKDF